MSIIKTTSLVAVLLGWLMPLPAIAALQYFGGDYPTSKKHLVVYLRSDLDPRAKLLLATAMTAILQSKLNTTLN